MSVIYTLSWRVVRDLMENIPWLYLFAVLVAGFFIFIALIKIVKKAGRLILSLLFLFCLIIGVLIFLLDVPVL